MGGRYLVTGVQLAMMQMNADDASLKLVNKIIDKQFVWDSDKSIGKDIEALIKRLNNEHSK